MAQDITLFTVKTVEQIRDDMLRTYANELRRRGIPNPNTSPGTEIYIRYTAIAQQIAIALNNTVIKADSQMIDTAQDGDLVRLAGLYGLSQRAAGGSAGYIVLSTTVGTTPIAIAVGSQLSDGSGLEYKVSLAGNYQDGDNVPVSAIDTGVATNLSVGEVLRWSAPPSYVTSTALVGSGGLTGGVDQETIEDLRTRLAEIFHTPPAGGNWSQVAGIAESSSTFVQKAFVYPACNGPATAGVAVITAPTATNKSRDITNGGSNNVLNSTVKPAIIAAFPEFAEFIITGTVDYPASVSMGLSLPSATTASPPGVGGGWLDAIPFPTKISQGFTGCTNVTASDHFQILADAAPQVGNSITWLSRDDWKPRVAKILSYVDDGGGFYTVVIDTPFTSDNGVDIAVGDWISPAAVNSETYYNAMLEVFANFGPGEKTNLSGLLPRASRRPSVSSTWVSNLGPSVIKFLENTGSEVLDVSYLYRSIVTPGVPGSIQDAPYVLTPLQIGFYPL